VTNPYSAYTKRLLRLRAQGAVLPQGGLTPPRQRQPGRRAPRLCIFSPHPDDECIIGGLALRLQREARYRVVNVAVTQGSRRERQSERWRELSEACHYLGFELLSTAPSGLTGVNLATKQTDPNRWSAMVDTIAGILATQRPRMVFMPHDQDWNSTHIGTHHLVLEALGRVPAFTCLVVETEFWGAMSTPNLMVELDARNLADLMAALSFHVGEVQRNPYHLTLPAWMQDNVRRGGELVGGQGGAAPPFAFATLYRLRRWTGHELAPMYPDGRMISMNDDLRGLFHG